MVTVSAVITNHDPSRVEMLMKAVRSAIESGADEVLVVRRKFDSLGEFDGHYREIHTDEDSPGGKQADGVLAATCDVVAFLDDDDVWARLKIECVRAIFDTRPKVVLFDHGNLIADSEGHALGIGEPGPDGRYVLSSNISVRREWAIGHAPFVRSARYSNDAAWLLAADLTGEDRIVVTNLPLTFWTYHGNNISRPHHTTLEEFCRSRTAHYQRWVQAEAVMMDYICANGHSRHLELFAQHQRRWQVFLFLSALTADRNARTVALGFRRAYDRRDRMSKLATLAILSPSAARRALFRFNSYRKTPGARA